jgi:predicted outer membrane repeat protein
MIRSSVKNIPIPVNTGEGNPLCRRDLRFFTLGFCQKIATILFLLHANPSIALNIEVDNFTAFNNAVANASVGTIFLTGDITATADIKALGSTILTIKAQPESAKHTILSNRKTGFYLVKNKTLNIDDGITLNGFFGNNFGGAIIGDNGAKNSQLIIGNHVKFYDNSSNNFGGAIFVDNITTVGQGVTFRNNKASYGGAICMGECVLQN